jgi:hypothetical protein
MSDPAKCELCGEPMPPGEEMFKFHGYSGNCPKPFLPRPIKVAIGISVKCPVTKEILGVEQPIQLTNCLQHDQ